MSDPTSIAPHVQPGAPVAATAAVGALYDEIRGAKDPERLAALLHPDVVFDIADGLPYGGRHHGVPAVLQHVWGAVAEDFEVEPVPEELLSVGDDAVLALGMYRGRARATGRELAAGFAHLWTVTDGRVSRLRHYTDTARWCDALGIGADATPDRRR